MTLSQLLLVADGHRMIRDEGADRVEVGSSDVSGSENRGGDQSDAATGSKRGDADASGRSLTPSKRVRERVRFDQIDCRPTIYHPGGIFEELAPLPPGLLREPWAQSWGNVFGSCASHHTVKDLLRASGGAGVTYIIPSAEQRPWSPPCLVRSTVLEGPAAEPAAVVVWVEQTASTGLSDESSSLTHLFHPSPRTTRVETDTSEPTEGWSAGRVSLGSESSETWSPPVAVGLVLKRRRRICWGRLVWPSGAMSAATKAANWSLVVFWTSS
ncbi:hypothetical protein F2Q70_00035743 [Brassica cretica]|uniref:Uncharacterized protein n=1 Tax=Brassica cretica TaxID=69181 RepID=A0A8S9JWG3_BRACR|nr:hypothetical protein F2Q70_00035743 [Brassica cretica]